MIVAEWLSIFKLRLRAVANRKRNFSQIQFPNKWNATVPEEGRFPTLGHPVYMSSSCFFSPKPIRPPGFYIHESSEWSCSQYLGVARLISFHSGPKQEMYTYNYRKHLCDSQFSLLNISSSCQTSQRREVLIIHQRWLLDQFLYWEKKLKFHPITLILAWLHSSNMPL